MNNINWNVSGVNHFPIPSSDGLLQKLPPAIYEVNFTNELGFHLIRKHDNYPLPSDLYNFNNTEVKSDLATLFLNRFNAEPNNLGVMLIGEKGTGKSLLMKRTANLAIESGMPVITIENSYNSEALAKFLSSIKDDAVVLFDEFEKKYDPDEDSENRPSQAGLLSFFDGTSVYRKLIIVTANDRDGINEFFLNRPSRIRYVIDYKGLTPEFVSSYLQEKLIHPEIVQTVMDELDLVPSINFDLLRNVVEEVNLLYPTESIKAIMSITNIKRDDSYEMYYEIYIKAVDGSIEVKCEFVSFDWDDLVNRGHEWVNIGFKAYDNLKQTYPKLNDHIQITPDSIQLVKGRNQFKATSELLLNDPGLPRLPVIIDFKRIKERKTF
jgi:hypothetical protein